MDFRSLRRSLGSKRFVITLLGFCCMMLMVLHFNEEPLNDVSAVYSEELKRRRVPMGNGNLVSYLELVRDLYERRGFKVNKNCTSHPWLSLRFRQENADGLCMDTFKLWLKYSNTSSPWPPPKIIPEGQVSEYLLNGMVARFSWYFSAKYDGNPIPLEWTPSMFSTYLQSVKKRRGFTYGAETNGLYSAIASYPVRGTYGAVIGSESPWVEAILIHNGAVRIVTVEYRKIISTIPHVSYSHPADFARKYVSGPPNKQTFDFIVSFSSIEHSGLGRYGDRLDPWADIQELRKCWCMLKDGGLLYLAVPFGLDQIVWNAHRIYGPIRLPMITAGFSLQDIFGINGRMSWGTSNDSYWVFTYPHKLHRQHVLVLRKQLL